MVPHLLSAAGPPHAGRASLRGHLRAGLGQTQSQEFALELGWFHPNSAVTRVLGAAWQISKLCCSQSTDAFVGSDKLLGGEGGDLTSFPPSSAKPKDDYLGGCTLGTFRICTGKLVPSWGQATCKVNATGEIVCRPPTGAGVWIREEMKILQARRKGRKRSEKRESAHNLCPGPWRSCHWLPLIEFDPHLLFFKLLAAGADACGGWYLHPGTFSHSVKVMVKSEAVSACVSECMCVSMCVSVCPMANGRQ